MHHGALWTNKCSYVAVKNTNSIQSCNSRGRLHFLLVNLKFDSKMNRIRCGPQKQKIINACEKNPSLKEAVLHGPITSHFSESKMNHFSNLLQPDKKFEQIWSSLQATFPMKRLSFQNERWSKVGFNLSLTLEQADHHFQLEISHAKENLSISIWAVINSTAGVTK